MRGRKPAGLADALLKVQAETPVLELDAINQRFGNEYISLDTLMPQMLPLLHKYGILAVQSPSNINGQPALRTQLVHVESGELIEDTTPLILDKADARGQGSAITYAQRYALMSLLGLEEPEMRRLVQTPRREAA
jgi:hypothetical protein